jgi:bacterial/archaeal transporter family protein
MLNSLIAGHNLWAVYACLSALFAALATIFAKVSLLEIAPNLGNAVRTVVFLPLVWGLVWWEGSYVQLREISGRAWLALCLSGLAGGASWLFYFQALKGGKVSQVVPIDKLSVVITVAFAVLFLQEELTWKTGLGIAAIVAGSFVLLS